MNWKKIIKYALILLLVSTVAFAYLANQNMNKIYGGQTEVADYHQFDMPVNPVYINHVNLLDPESKEFIPDQTVYIDHGMIMSIDSTSTISYDAQVINGTGKYLVPGLIDSHVHLFKSPNDLLLYVANGVTEIREMIGEPDHLKWRTAIKAGRIGPDMYIASPRLGSFGLIEGWWMNWTQKFNNVRNADEAKSMVKQYAQQGYDAVKVYSYLNKEAFDAVNEVAIAEGLDVVGHIPFDLKISDVLTSNQSDIAHLEEIMNAFRREFGRIEDQNRVDSFLTYVEKRSKEIAPQLIKKDMTVTTTLWLTKSFLLQKFELQKVLESVALPYENPGISEWDEMIPQGLGWLPEVNRYKLPESLTDEDKVWQKMFWSMYAQACEVILKALSDQGVKIIAGTDANLPPTVPGFSLHDELIAMNNAGMTPTQVLQSATAIPAQRLRNNTGKIVQGAKANLVLLDENPLVDISNTRKINTVFLNGRILDRSTLNRMLEAVKSANDRSRTKEINQFLIINN